jgi:MazG family protein
MEKTSAAPPELPDLRPLPGKQSGEEFGKLVALMQRLLAPDGCPWDREQTLETLVPYLVEETYEVVDAIASGDPENHREELGDLLLQVVFQSELRHAEGIFGIDDVARGIVSKLVRRHPHVFGDVKAQSAQEALASWAKLKAVEKAEKADKGDQRKPGALHGIPRSAPALLRASRAGEKASAVGFDWPDAIGPRAKINEELAELDDAVKSGDREEMGRELGDVLLAVVNLSRKLGLDAESALRQADERFSQRFSYIEETLAKQGRAVRDASAEEQDQLWEAAKKVEAAVRRGGQSQPR